MARHTRAASREQRAVFTIATTAIPVGVRCESCGRLHLPARLRSGTAPNGDNGRADGGVVLRCAKCGATRLLAFDTSDPLHEQVVRAIGGGTSDE